MIFSDTEQNICLRWKGVVSGPFSRKEIYEMLERGEISLIHSLEVEGRWGSVGQFVERHKLHVRRTEAPAAASGGREESPAFSADEFEGAENAVARAPVPAIAADDWLVRAGFVCCGAAFLLPVLATVPAFMIAAKIAVAGEVEQASFQKKLALIFTLSGIVFWGVVYLAMAQPG